MRAVRAVLSTALKSALNESVVFSMVLPRSPGFCIEDPKKKPDIGEGRGGGRLGSLQERQEEQI